MMIRKNNSEKIWEMGLEYLGVNYVWGGNDASKGLDCSGLICDLLRRKGIIGKKDYSSQMLFNELKFKQLTLPQEDSLLFFGKDFNKITHVAVAINYRFMLEASGEGRIPTNEGKVRIKPISSRSDYLCSMTVI